MAPEQLLAGRAADRADRHLRAGAAPVRTGRRSARVHAIRHADESAATAVDAPAVRESGARARHHSRRSSPDPQARPESAEAVANSLPTITGARTGPRTQQGRAQRDGGSWQLALPPSWRLASSPYGSSSSRSGNQALTAQDTIVLADFANTTGDPVFDGALKVALAVALEQSPFLKVFPDERVRDTLRLMNRPPDEPVTRSIAREVAQREQLKALLAGSIAPLGRNYVIAVEAVNALTGDVMAREQVEVAGKEQVLTALGGVASRLREKLGESLASTQKFDVPLPRATTPSLEALHAYALALDEGRVNPRLEAIPHLKRAIELDPDFAMALALLSGVYANTDQTALAPEQSRRAFALQDRVSERERFFISWRYYRDAAQAWDKALELAQSWTADVSARGVRVQQSRRGVHLSRPVRSGGRTVSGSDAARPEVPAADLQPRRRVHGAQPLR